MTQTKYKRIPFNLELAKKIMNKEVKGRIVSEDGRKVRIIYIDNESFTETTFLAMYKDFNIEKDYRLNKDGRYFRGERSDLDLFLEVPTYYKDYSNFVPQEWQPCLVREKEDELWLLQVSKGKRCDDGVLFYCPDGSPNVWRHCLPLTEITKRLIGTTKSYEQLIQELDAESTATNQEPDAESTSIIPDVEFEDDKQFDFHEIKTFADACEKLGMKEHLLTVSWCGDVEAQGQAQALYKLLIIQKAINNCKWRDEDGWRYYPYWQLYSKDEMESMSERGKQERGIRQLLSCADAVDTESSGVRSALVSGRCADAHTDFGFPLCFNSKEAALYAAKQFEDLFFQYYGIKVKS